MTAPTLNTTAHPAGEPSGPKRVQQVLTVLEDGTPAIIALMAAAPALLEELESLIERSDDLCESSDAYYRSEMQGRIEEARALLDEVMS